MTVPILDKQIIKKRAKKFKRTQSNRFVSVKVEFAYMLGMHRQSGFQCEGNSFKLRIPFPRRAADRKDVKTLIVEMLQAARSQQPT